jgi:hypothetical protein
VWTVDQDINKRGFYIDMASNAPIREMLKRYETELLSSMERLTDGEVRTPRQIDKMKKWLAGCSVYIANLQKPTVEEVLEQNIPEKARKVLKIRQQLGKSSTAKFQAMVEVVGDDQRAETSFCMGEPQQGAGQGKKSNPKIWSVVHMRQMRSMMYLKRLNNRILTG